MPAAPAAFILLHGPACDGIPTEFDVLLRHSGFLFQQPSPCKESSGKRIFSTGRLGKDGCRILFNRKELIFIWGNQKSPSVQIGTFSRPSPISAFVPFPETAVHCLANPCGHFPGFRDIHFPSRIARLPGLLSCLPHGADITGRDVFCTAGYGIGYYYRVTGLLRRRNL